MLKISSSAVHGIGIFATSFIKKGSILYSAFVQNSDGGFTAIELQRYQNHSENKNAVPKLKNGRIVIVAIRNIKNGEEILCDYNDLIKISSDFQNILNFKITTK